MRYVFTIVLTAECDDAEQAEERRKLMQEAALENARAMVEKRLDEDGVEGSERDAILLETEMASSIIGVTCAPMNMELTFGVTP